MEARKERRAARRDRQVLRKINLLAMREYANRIVHDMNVKQSPSRQTVAAMDAALPALYAAMDAGINSEVPPDEDGDP